MTKRKVYLCGPIGDVTYTEATGWREAARAHLMPNIEPVSPMRGKEFLADYAKADEKIGQAVANAHAAWNYLPYANRLILDPAFIATRDFGDIAECDALVARLRKGARADGSHLEVGYAYALGIPVIVVTDDLTIEHHPLFKRAAAFITSDLLDAWIFLNAMFGEDEPAPAPRPSWIERRLAA